MLTPAQKHYQRVMAERHGRAEDLSDTARTAHEQILHRMRMDMSALKKIQSDQAKAALKRQLLPNYEGWIEGSLAGNSGRQDEVITRLMIWAIDAGDYPLAVRIGRYVITHNLAMPDKFNRTAATALVDEICDPILVQVKADENADITSFLAVLDDVAQVTENSDMPDVVRAKLCKARAFALRSGTPEQQATALELMRTALVLDPGAGVKRQIETLSRQLKKAAAGTDDAGQTESGGRGAGSNTENVSAAPPEKAVPAEKKAAKAAGKTAARKPAARKTTTRKPAAKK